MNITGGKFKGQKIIAPDCQFTRPTLSKIRESVFNILYSMIDFECKSFLDMFSGSGIMGLEAISRGFTDVVCLEKNPKVASIIKTNYRKLGLIPNLIIGDSIKSVFKLDKSFDVIYIDPPYDSNLYSKCINAIDETKLLKESGILILEHQSEIDFEGYKIIKNKKYSQKYVTFLIK